MKLNGVRNLLASRDRRWMGRPRSDRGPPGTDTRDSARLGEFLEKYRVRGTAYCRGIVKDAHAAEDMFQQACLRLHRRGVREMEDEAGCRSLLYTTLTNLCRDHLAWRKRRRLTPATVRPMREPAQAAEEREEIDRLEAAIGELAVHQKMALLMKTLEGLSYREIAARLRVSETNVGVLIYRARERLRRALTLEED